MVHLRRVSVTSVPLLRRGSTPWCTGARRFHQYRQGMQQVKHASKVSSPANNKSRRKEAERDFFLSVLGASATKRDARAYLSKFKPSAGASPRHIALLMIRSLGPLPDDVVDGLCQTISQMTRLGLHCVVVLDSDDILRESHGWTTSDRHSMAVQADRLVRGLENHPLIKASRLDDLLELSELECDVRSTVQIRGSVEVQHPRLLIRLLQRGIIPVIPPFAFQHQDSQSSVVTITGDEVVLALTRYFAGLRIHLQSAQPSDFSVVREPADDDQISAVLDRMIILDPAGPLPSTRRAGRGHVFLNLEQEYHDIRKDLVGSGAGKGFLAADSLRQGNTMTSPIEGTKQTIERRFQASSTGTGRALSSPHVKNLDLLRGALSLLPPSASALLTTPAAAATLPQAANDNLAPGVGTRRPKNPLIFNLLTNKPLNSSSLPSTRLSQSETQNADGQNYNNIATFAKRGMQLTMIPDPRVQVWKPPAIGEKQMSLQDPDIDFPRLLSLIEDSFNRPLDVADYMKRIQNRIAGIIVAGEYEGGAVLTWELPPGVPDDGSETSRSRMVPYLDKFAVLKRSQGAGGVADIVFSAMVRSCFPEGVCWRSRRDNPVNKWYFERAAGSWKIPDTNWTMFWTDPDLALDGERFLDYEAVCRSVKPSWADNKAVVD